MAPRIKANVKPELLVWARESAGLARERAAFKMKIQPSLVTAWEDGADSPSVSQLRKLASLYKRPLVAFFLPAPPPPAPFPHDFRRLQDAEEGMSPELLLELRRARRRRQVALELRGEIGIPAPRFDLRASTTENAETVATRIRERLGIALELQRSWINDYEMLRGWTAAIEALGVLVFQTGRVSLKQMRGFSISEDLLPVIVLNGKDAPRPRAFTLMHELTHLALHESGVCDPLRSFRGLKPADEKFEVFCNRVAGAILVPAASLLAEPDVRRTQSPRDWRSDELAALADRYRVSREVVLRRLLILGKTTEAFYESVRAIIEAQQKVVKQPNKKIVVPPYRKALASNGREYTRLVLDAYERDRITSNDVADYLGINLRHLNQITQAVQAITAE